MQVIITVSPDIDDAKKKIVKELTTRFAKECFIDYKIEVKE